MKGKIMQIISDILKIPVNEGISKNNCSRWDSLMHLNIIVAIEESFDIYFDPEDIESIESVKTIEECVKKKLA
jgi:acyl carrier protein